MTAERLDRISLRLAEQQSRFKNPAKMYFSDKAMLF
jgi:hypothetical protein